MGPAKVFISYSHADKKVLLDLRTHLESLEQEGLIELWDDTGIEPGSKWPQEIEDALATAKIAILLVSASFLSSKFINSKELPDLLTAAEARGTHIIPIIVTACSYDSRKELQHIQAVNFDKPLNKKSKADRDILFNDVVTRVRRIVSSLKPIDATPPHTVEPDLSVPADKKSAGPPKEVNNSTKDSGKANSAYAGARWKHFVFPGLAGLVLGAICAVIFIRYVSSTPSPPASRTGLVNTPCPQVTTYSSDKIVLIIGSGTVYSYLKSSDPCIVNNLSNDKQINVQLLQGPTGTGAKLFGHLFEQIPTLVMSSKRLKLRELSRSEPNQTGEKREAQPQREPERKPQAVFEVYLGADTYQMLLVAGSQNARDTTLKKDFGDILSASSGGNEPKIAFSTLANIKRWINGEYNVYVGSDSGATRELWKERLGKAWPAKLYFWDLQNPEAINRASAEPNIYLGSEILLNVEENRGITNSRERVTMLDDSGKPVRRGLYLYGYIDEDNRNKEYGGYYLSPLITEILKYLLDSLKESKPKLIDDDCLQKQRDYFHLDSPVGWVKSRPANDPDGTIYRADVEPCREQPGD